MEGIRIACLYSYGCNKTTLLGVNPKLLAFVSNPKPGKDEVSEICSILNKLIPYPAYRSLANIAGQGDCFDESIVRVYWFGNQCLASRQGHRLNHNQWALNKVKEIRNQHGLTEKATNLVLDCTISWGEVVSKNKTKLRVKNHRFLCQRRKIFFGEQEREIEVGFIKKVRPGNLISIHLGIARERISKAQAGTLKQTTLEALRIF